MRVDTAAWIGVGIRHDAADHLARRPLGEKAVALIDDPLVQLIAQIAHRGEADLLEGVLGEERRQRAEDEDDEQRDQDARGTVACGRPSHQLLKAARRSIVAVDHPPRCPFRKIAFENGVEHRCFAACLARQVTRRRPVLRREAEDDVEERLDQRRSSPSASRRK